MFRIDSHFHRSSLPASRSRRSTWGLLALGGLAAGLLVALLLWRRGPAPTPVPEEQVGQWTHLAVVYDAEEGQVSHYVDGKAVKHIPVQFDIPLRLGDVEVGNWNVATRRDASPVRYLRGGIDEFLLFSRALTEHEVERLYTQGRPPL